MLFWKNSKESFFNSVKHQKEERFKKIMLLSCVKLNNNNYQITYCLDYVASVCDYKGLLINTYVVNDTKLINAPKNVFGVWCKAKFNYEGHILYLSNFKQ